MVNYQDPATILQDFTILVKLWHVVNGLFIWEFITTLNHEWEVFRGHRPYRWTIWIYSLARLGTLLTIILNMVGFDTTTKINCQVWVTFSLGFAFLASATSTLLIVLRMKLGRIAVWDRHMVVVIMSMGMWLTDIAFLIVGIIRIRSTWSQAANTCALLNIDVTKLSIIGVLVTDVVLLVTMLVGLLRTRFKGSGAFGLASVLWKQGLVWLLIATVAEVPPATFMILNLNTPLDLISLTPCNIMVTIAATRMYRLLVDFNSSESSHVTPLGTERATSRFRSVNTGPIPLSRMEVSVNTEFEQYPAPHNTRTVSFIGKDPQDSDKTHDMSFNVDVESL